MHQEQLEVRACKVISEIAREELDGRRYWRLQTQTAGTESELKALQGVFREELGYGQRRRSGAEVPRFEPNVHSIQAALAERIQVPEEVELAIESALGGHLQAWLVQLPSRSAGIY